MAEAGGSGLRKSCAGASADGMAIQSEAHATVKPPRVAVPAREAVGHNRAMSEVADPAPLSASPRLYCADPLPVAGPLLLPAEHAHHAVRVLRLREGDALTLFDGRGGERAARLERIDRERAVVEITAVRAVERESVLRLSLVQCLQGGDKMDFTIQKAVELGVDELVPVQSRRSVVRLDGERAEKRRRHWRQVVIAACEQCGRNRLPVVHEVEAFERWLARPAPPGALRLHLSPAAVASIATLPAPTAVELLIGPEGGLAPEELRLAEAAGFVGVRLGPRVLRTETAGLAALSALHARWGDFL
jgi:16S rRNA (uracil1498-N3)-methyltransferase